MNQSNINVVQAPEGTACCKCRTESPPGGWRKSKGEFGELGAPICKSCAAKETRALKKK
jgi:hypothetical protein